MSKLDELIKEYCPDGVEYKKLKDIATITRGGSLQKKDFCDSGIPCIHYGQIYTRYGLTATETYTFIPEGIAARQRFAEPGDIVMAVTSENVEDICKCVAWLGKENAAVSGHTAIIHHNQNPKYMSYYFHTEMFGRQKLKYVHGTKVMEVTPDKLNDIVIPVPPLPVQEEIVRILDSFTQLTAELQAELQARKKQYEYYRNVLISKAEGKKGKLLDMLVQPITDGPHTTPVLYQEGIPFVSATAVYDGKVHLNDMKGYISKEFDEECAKKYKPRRNDVFMVKSGSTTGKVAFVDFDDDFNVWSPLAAMRTNDNNSPRFLYHLLQTTDIQNQVQERMSHGSQPNLSMRVLEKFDVNIPTLEKQNELVALLDRMDIICNDMFSGLPAEIEARQKQYEYYRDKLLTFQELS